MANGGGNDWQGKATQEMASRSNESIDSALPCRDDQDGNDVKPGASTEQVEQAEGEAALECSSTIDCSRSRGRHKDIFGSARWLTRTNEQQHGDRPGEERKAELCKRRMAIRDRESHASTVIRIAAATTTAWSEDEADQGYESSSSDYSDIWNDYHSPSQSDDEARQEMEREYEKIRATHDRLCAEPPPPPSPTVRAIRYGEHHSWNAHAFNPASRLGER